jgi:hypothetical protein
MKNKIKSEEKPQWIVGHFEKDCYITCTPPCRIACNKITKASLLIRTIICQINRI